MKNIKWSVYQGCRHLDSGTVLAKSDREVLRRLLARDLGDFKTEPQRHYQLSAGDAMASVYGDEFDDTAYAVGDPDGLPGEAPFEELAPKRSGYLFEEPVTQSFMRTCSTPGDHVLIARSEPILRAKVFACQSCGRSYAVPDLVLASFRGDAERMVREALTP